MSAAINVDFVIAVNTQAGCYGVGETSKEAARNCNKERSRYSEKTQPTVFYYFGNCQRAEVTIILDISLTLRGAPNCCCHAGRDEAQDEAQDLTLYQPSSTEDLRSETVLSYWKPNHHLGRTQRS